MSKRSNNKSNRRSARNKQQLISDTREWRAPQMVVYRGLGMPDAFETTLMYASNGFHFASSATPAAQVFAANSVFDPDVTGTGHQPHYFDQLAAIYTEYTVLEFRAEMSISNQSTTIPANWVYLVSDSDSSSASVESLTESQYATSGIIAATGSGPASLTVRTPPVSIVKLSGHGQAIRNDTVLSAIVSLNPADLIYFIFKMSDTSGVSSMNCYVNFKLFFRTVFRGLAVVGES